LGRQACFLPRAPSNLVTPLLEKSPTLESQLGGIRIVRQFESNFVTPLLEKSPTLESQLGGIRIVRQFEALHPSSVYLK